MSISRLEPALFESIQHNSLIPSSSLNLQGKKMTDTDVEHIAHALLINTTLITLHLGHNNITAIGAQHIAHALLTNNTLTILDLRYNQITDTGARALFQTLTPGAVTYGTTPNKTNTSLTHLNLSNNSITDSGAQAVLAAIHVNDSLLEVNLNNNHDVTDPSLTAIETATKKNGHNKKQRDSSLQQLLWTVHSQKILSELPES